ncbi:MAG: ParB/RepB/Spo0J family partition protein [Clostridium sp.]|uniref:ParB/RepB/Spo0J family partition protein n=1 Tax=Clostridium sp. TaxID=1506 RepID=UPI0025B87B91|nr:ParB/RepB/Spo0J family partition protein [Clostridium sp.]MCH3965496.1 ParB/RepB/Spo0J family partition protein [Clostridium sp.]MCI1716825.1 ParB/RepB/Spo0J family partition protein [Clostridium sp.]MCI1801245.1 ParB/RepB/Spo0J family partition protein [Clostridium sp.]MCI1815011.1 ParB/RepB/Spo0J family partition protein [Clostridium sp.]MCI1871912.1 ParB/RepB/Spo0J family partition protein [Clostridium sp.]
MKKKSGLGRGLGALIPENISDNSLENIKKVRITSIIPNEDQPRKKFDENKIAQLSQSIIEHGIIQPLILKEYGEKYIIVAGERRWRAAKLANIEEVPAIIMDLSDSDILEISLIENIQRQDLNPIEEAIAYKKLIEDLGLKQDELANRIGKSRTAITNCMRLLNLDNRVQQYIIDGFITEGHGRAILSLEDSNLQYELAGNIIKKGLSVRQTEKYIKNINLDNKHNNENVEKYNLYYKDIQEKLEYLFGTKVILNNKKNKGKIEIEYYSQEDLQRIIDILKI